MQARLVEPLIANLGKVVDREQLVRAGWPQDRPARNTVDVHMARLRSRLASIGLTLRTVRSRGFLLDSDS
jgi:DNA-binding response OmpR family regulator